MNKVTILSKEVEVLFDELRDQFLSSEEFKNITDEAEKSAKKDEYTDILLELIPSKLNEGNDNLEDTEDIPAGDDNIVEEPEPIPEEPEHIGGSDIPGDTGSDEGSDDTDSLNYDEV